MTCFFVPQNATVFHASMPSLAKNSGKQYRYNASRLAAEREQLNSRNANQARVKEAEKKETDYRIQQQQRQLEEQKRKDRAEKMFAKRVVGYQQGEKQLKFAKVPGGPAKPTPPSKKALYFAIED